MVQVDFCMSQAAPAAVRMLGFAEPDWQGDRDYQGLLAEAALDAMIVRIEAEISAGREGGWLDAYYARRAAFDLQSIRGQIARERRGRSGEIAEDTLRAIVSRADRLSACLGGFRPVEG